MRISKIINIKRKYFRKEKKYSYTVFPADLFSADVNVYMQRHKCALFRTQFRSSGIIVYFHTVDVPNGENDSVAWQRI